MVYTETEKKAYNTGFYSGARYIVMRIVANINGYNSVKCFDCGYRHPKNMNLELHDKVSPEKEGNNNRNFDDWVNIENLEILCGEGANNCHGKTDGWRNKY